MIRRLLPLTLGFVTVLGFVTLPGCDDEEAPSAAPADATYTVRGRLADIIGDEISVQHEAIPDFVNREGETVGMETMTMPFHRPESVSLDGIEVGDAIELTFEVRWEADHSLSISALRELPAGTELQL